MSLTLRMAGRDDLAHVVTLMNAAFRGGGEQSGWSTEAGYIIGDRTSESMLMEEISSGVLLLVVDREEGRGLSGCVSLKPISPVRWYLGSLTVDPKLQNAGFGRKLLEAAEAYAQTEGASMMEITVVNVRDALIAWYERRGYVRISETRPFPYDDERFGTPLRDDLEFAVFEKHLSPR